MHDDTAFDGEMRALVVSIGEQTLTYLGKDNLDAARVTLDPKLQVASVEVSLTDPSPEARLKSFEKFIDVECIFADEVDLVLHISDRDQMQTARLDARTLAHSAL